MKVNVSLIPTFLDCSKKWAYIEIDKKRGKYSPSAITGTATHKGIEEYLINKDITVAVQKGINYLIDNFTINDYTITSEPEIIEFNIKKWVNEAYPSLKQIDMIEEKLILAEGNFELVGKLDLFADNKIIDIKTTSRKTQPNKYGLQLAFYSILLQRNFGIVVTEGEIHNIVNGKNLFFFSLDLKPFIEQAKKLLETLKGTIELYQLIPDKGDIIFRPNYNSFLCSEQYCDFYNECKGKLS